MEQHCDGFDLYGNNYSLVAGYPWDAVYGAGTVVTTDYRFAPPAVTGCPGECVQITGGYYIRKNLSGTPAGLIVMTGIKVNGLPAAGQTSILDFWNNGNYQAALALTSQGALQFYRGNGEAPGSGGANLSVAIGSSSGSGTIVANAWYGLVLKVVFNTSTGSVLLYVNGAASAAINSTGLNTSGDTNAYATQVSLGNSIINLIKYDDFVCWDTTGGAQNTVPNGDRRVISMYPIGAGNYTNWTPVGHGSNYLNAASQPPNTSDYNSNNTPTTLDSYLMPDPGLTVNPDMVLVRASLYRDDGATHTPSLLVRSPNGGGGTNALSAATAALTSSPVFYDYVPANDPNTSAPWTAAGINAQIEVGVEEN